MADTTISSSDPRRLYDRDDSTLTSGPPPKKTTSSSTDAQPTLTGPTAYDVKDVAKHMPVTTMELSLDAQKAAVDKRLASPTDYPKRKYDEALRDDLARRILDRDTQAKAAAKEAQCPTWAACQPVPKGYDPNQGGWKVEPSKYTPEAPKTREGQLLGVGGKDQSVRVGFVDATTATDSGDGRQRVDQVAVGVAKGQNTTTGSDGVTRSTTVVVGTAFAQTGPTNPDGSKGLGFDVGATAVGIERSYEAPDGTGLTLGASAGVSVGGSLGVKDAKNGGAAVCGRAELGPVTVGACVPIKQGGSES